MNIFCEILLIVAAAAIGRLWPRKPVTVEKIVEKKSELTLNPYPYGINIPKNTRSINIRGIKAFYTYTDTSDGRVYNSISITPHKDMRITFDMPSSYRASSSDIEGEVHQ